MSENPLGENALVEGPLVEGLGVQGTVLDGAGVLRAPSLTGRTGYDPLFLAPGPRLPLPVPTEDVELRTLAYTNFTVLLRPDRRLAAMTVVAIDGDQLADVGRGGDRWFLDPRVDVDEQAGPELYSRNDFDRGHLVRRRDPVWGAAAEQANADTFSYTNAAPQVNSFNQSLELWLGLEDHVLDWAHRYDQRVVVLTGPVFEPDDPVYRGVQIPRRFFKVAAYLSPGPTAADGAEDAAPELSAVGFVLDQGDLVADLVGTPAASRVPELGGFRTFQVPVADIDDLIGFDLEQLVAADRLPGAVPAARLDDDGVPAWQPVSRPEHLVL